MAEVQRVDIVIPQGTTYVHTFTYVDANGTPIDVTGYTGWLQIRSTVTSSTVLYEALSSAFTLGGVAGTITLTIPAATTAGWTWRTGTYDLNIVAGSIETRICKGAIKVDPAVTHA